MFVFVWLCSCVCVCVVVFVCLCVCVCVLVCVVCVFVVCVCVCVCLWCVVVFGVWCGTQKKPPCVDSKRPRVYRHHAHMCQNMRAWCRYTQGRFESTHGGFFCVPHEEGSGEGERKGVTVSSAYQDWSTSLSLAREVHRKLPQDLTNFKFENRSRTTRAARFLQSFAFPDKAV